MDAGWCNRGSLPEDPMTKRIPLSQGKFAIVDDEDFYALSKFKWCAVKMGNSFYASRNNPRGSKPNLVYMHRQIMDDPKGFDIDHRNRNGLDNRRSNLRVATRAQNGANSRLSIANKSGVKGVDWMKSSEKWRARIGIRGERRWLGLFDTIEEATLARQRAAKEAWGEFAREIER